MLKLLGAFCVVAGSGWLGLCAVGRLRRRERTLERLGMALGWLAEELAFRLTPLPDLLGKLAAEQTGPVGLFFRDALAGLERNREGGLRQSWRQAMVRRLDFLKEEERQVLVEAGQVLGRFDAGAQAEALRRAVRRLDAIRSKAGEDTGRLSRVYTALGLSAGAALALVLL